MRSFFVAKERNQISSEVKSIGESGVSENNDGDE